jgi:hypothetical protein
MKGIDKHYLNWQFSQNSLMSKITLTYLNLKVKNVYKSSLLTINFKQSLSFINMPHYVHIASSTQ